VLISKRVKKKKILISISLYIAQLYLQCIISSPVIMRCYETNRAIERYKKTFHSGIDFTSDINIYTCSTGQEPMTYCRSTTSHSR